MRYSVEKYSGKTYCGNALFDTLDECYSFMNDEFCDRMIIIDHEYNIKLKVTKENILTRYLVRYIDNVTDKTSEIISYANSEKEAIKNVKKQKFCYKALEVRKV